MKKFIAKWLVPCALALTGTAHALPDASQDIDAVKTWAFDRIQEAEQSFNQSGNSREASSGFWGGEIVYEIQVDRFNNGDLSNDNLNIEDHQRNNQDTSDLWGLHSYRHGGDIQGIIDRLDYIRDLGASAIWITPVFKNTGAYHGYCVQDFTEIDPGFGTAQDLRRLSKEAHERGIKIILDVVINHICDSATTYGWEPQGDDHQTCANELNAAHWGGSGGGSNKQGTINFSGSFFPPLKNEFFLSRCGANSQADMEGEAPVSVFGDFVRGMYDFDTRNHDFQQIFTDIHKWWIAYADVDGFRLDAAKHVTEDFVAYFSTHIRAYAASIGKHDFYVVGEVAGSQDLIGRRLGNMFHDPNNPDAHGDVPASLTARIWDLKSIYDGLHIAKPGMTAAYDMAQGGRAREALTFDQNRGIDWMTNYFGDDYYHTIAAQQDPRYNLVNLEIHDWPRFVRDFDSNPWKSRQGVKYMATIQGIPIIYYGQEQGFAGTCRFDNMTAGAANGEQQNICNGHDHALYRQDMFVGGPYKLKSTVSEINNLAHIGKVQKQLSPNWQDDPFLNRDHSVYQNSRKFNFLRRSCDAMKYGYTVYRWGTDDIAVYSKVDNGEEIIVVLNNASFTRSIPNVTIDDKSCGVQYTNVENGFQHATNNCGNFNFNGLQIEGNDVMVFVKDSNLAPWSDYLGIHQCNDNPQWPPFDDQPQAPTARIAGDTSLTVLVNSTLTFDGSGSTDSDGQITGYSWNTGGNQSTETVLFDVLGEQTITLTVTDNDGLTGQASVVVDVVDELEPEKNFSEVFLKGTGTNWQSQNMTLVADFTWETTVSFDGQGDGNGGDRFKFDVPPGDWSHNYGDDNNDFIADRDGDDITIDEGAGNYRIRFNDETLAYSVIKIVVPQPPVIEEPLDFTAFINLPITLSANVTDPNDDITTYLWVIDGQTHTTETVTLTYNTEQIVTGTLTVTDAEGLSDTANVTIEVTDKPLDKTFDPVYFKGTASGWQAVEMDLIADFTWKTIQTFGAESDARFKFDVPPNNWSHNYGDDNNDGVAERSGDDIFITQGAGQYEIVFNDNTKAYSVTKIVVPMPPVINPPFEYTAFVGQPTTLTANATDPNNDIVSYQWSIAGESFVGESFTTQFNSISVRFGTLTVTDAQGMSDTASITVNVIDKPLEKTFEQVYFKGTASSWQPVEMDHIADFTWRTVQTFGAESDARFKFDVPPNDWSHNYGDDNRDGIAERSGDDIFITQGAGQYEIIFNDNTKAYSVTKIVVPMPPTINPPFEYTAIVGQTTTLTANATDPNNDIVTYRWTIGGQTFFGESVDVPFNTIATLVGTLFVEDSEGMTDTATITVNVIDRPLEKVFDPVYFKGTASSWQPVEMNLIGDFTWQTTQTFGSSSNARFKFDTPPNDWSHNYGDNNNDRVAERSGEDIFITEGAGDYIITFNDNTKAYSVVKIVGPQAPVADAGEDQTVRPGTAVTLNGTGSTDVDGSITNMTWTSNGFTGGAVGGASPIVTFVGPGAWTVTLTVTDNDGMTDTDTVVITVAENQAPTAVLEVLTQPIFVGEPVTFSASNSTDPDGSIFLYRWFTEQSESFGETMTHTYQVAGTYSVDLRVTDNEGEAHWVSTQIEVLEAPTTVSVTFTCHNGQTTNGTSVYVVGNIPELGGWALQSAAQKLDVNGYPRWTATFDMPANTDIEWKCVKADEQSLTISQWQGGDNNQITTPSTGSRSTEGNF